MKVVVGLWRFESGYQSRLVCSLLIFACYLTLCLGQRIGSKALLSSYDPQTRLAIVTNILGTNGLPGVVKSVLQVSLSSVLPIYFS